MLRQVQHERKMVVTANTDAIALSTGEGCAQLPRSNVLVKYAFAHRFFARLASEIFLSSLQTEFNNC